jgi:hypothetical protein
MSSTYSTNLKLNLIDTGTDAGTWGVTTNSNLGTALEQSIIGLGTVTYSSDGNQTLTLADSESSQTARNLVLRLVTSVGVNLTVTRDLIVPALKKNFLIRNGTNGSQSIRVINTGGGGTSVTIPNGLTASIYNDGTNIVEAFDYFTTLKVGTLTPTAITAGTLTGSTIDSSTANSLTNNQPLTKGEKVVISALGTLTTGTTTIDLSLAQSYTATITAAATITFAFSNPPTSTQGQVIILKLTNAGGATAINWPAGTQFPDGDETLGGLTVTGVDMLGIYYDAISAIYMVFPVGLNMAV